MLMKMPVYYYYHCCQRSYVHSADCPGLWFGRYGSYPWIWYRVIVMMYRDEMRKTTPPRPLFLAADADAATTTNNRMEQINLDGRMRYNLWWYRPGALLPSEIETDRRPPCLLGVSLLKKFWSTTFSQDFLIFSELTLWRIPTIPFFYPFVKVASLLFTSPIKRR